MLMLIRLLIVFFCITANAKEQIRILWPFSPGPGYSSLLRTIEYANESQSKYEFIPEIKQGAGGTVAALYSLQHENTLFVMSTSSFLTKPVLTPEGSHSVSNYQPVYILVLTQPLVVVSKKYSLRELLEKDKPTIAIAAPGGISDFVAQTLTKGNVETIAYRTFTESKIAAAGGHTDAGVTTISEVLSLVNDGKLSILGITGVNGSSTFKSKNISGLENLVNDNVIFAPKTFQLDKLKELNRILNIAGNHIDVQYPLLDDNPTFVMYDWNQTVRWYKNQQLFWSNYLNTNYINRVN